MNDTTNCEGVAQLQSATLGLHHIARNHWWIHGGGSTGGTCPPPSHNVAGSTGHPKYKIAFSFRGLRPPDSRPGAFAPEARW